MREYVLNYISANESNKVVFVEKHRPNWQKGKFNLTGGKVEQGETSFMASVRELKEECGMEAADIYKMEYVGGIEGNHDENGEQFFIYVYNIVLRAEYKLIPAKNETEKPFWAVPTFVVDEPRCLPNLKIIVPLLEFGVTGWIITDSNLNNENKIHNYWNISLLTEAAKNLEKELYIITKEFVKKKSQEEDIIKQVYTPKPFYETQVGTVCSKSTPGGYLINKAEN